MRILIADDHEFVRRGVRSVVQGCPGLSVCGEAIDGQDAIEQARQLEPDVIVMDISMPRLDGLEATREIRRILPQIHVLIVSQHDSPEVIRQAANAGARGYVVKSAVAENLIAGIDAVRRGQLFFDAAISRTSDTHLDMQEILQRSAALERALRESEERFRLTFEQAAVGIAHVAENGRWIRVNQKLCEIVGYTQEELRRLTFQDVTHPADLAADIAQARRVIKGELDQYSMEKRYIRKDGSPVWINLTVSTVRDAKCKLKYFISVVEDISARKQADHSANLLAAIVDSSDDAIVSKDLDGVITSWNRAAERLFDYTAEEAIGQNITLIIPPDRLQEEVAILEQIKRGEQVDHFETIRIRKDGAPLDISLTISPVRDSAGRIVGASKIARNIGERKRADEALRQSEERFRAIVETTPECVELVSSDGTLLHMNSSGLTMIEAESSEMVVGKSVYELIAEEDRERFRAFNERVCQGEKGSLSFSIVGLNGTRRQMETHAAPLRQPDGTLIQLSVTRDVSVQKSAEEGFRKSEERFRALAGNLDAQVHARTAELEMRSSKVLEQSEQLRDLSARLLQAQDDERRRIARELHDSAGQILTALGISLASVADGAAADGKTSKAIQDSQHLVAQLSQEIRTMSYLLHPPLLDESGLVEALRWYVRGLSERSELDIQLDIPPGFERLSSEIELVIFRVVQESLTNIHRHSRSTTAHIRIARDEDIVSVEIQDNGKGIPREKLIQIQSHGSGVGIRGMRERVRQFKGEIKIESNEAGTKVCVALPFPKPPGSKNRRNPRTRFRE